MAHKLAWHMSEEVLLLTLSGNFTNMEAEEVNQTINDELEVGESGRILLIDASDLIAPVHFESIRRSLTFMNDQHLKSIYVVAGNKLTRLAMLVIFNLGKASLKLFNSVEQADHQLRAQLN